MYIFEQKTLHMSNRKRIKFVSFQITVFSSNVLSCFDSSFVTLQLLLSGNPLHLLCSPLYCPVLSLIPLVASQRCLFFQRHLSLSCFSPSVHFLSRLYNSLHRFSGYLLLLHSCITLLLFHLCSLSKTFLLCQHFPFRGSSANFAY